jgi:hypothetical protein
MGVFISYPIPALSSFQQKARLLDFYISKWLYLFIYSHPRPTSPPLSNKKDLKAGYFLLLFYFEDFA